MVTAAEGWFLPGKCSQYLNDPDSDATLQAFQAASRMLLAEPEFEFDALRDRLGVNAGLLAALTPQLGRTLGVLPDLAVGNPASVQGRLCQAGLDLLAGMAAPYRPVVLFLDDIQWADAISIDFIDAILMDDRLRNACSSVRTANRRWMPRIHFGQCFGDGRGSRETGLAADWKPAAHRTPQVARPPCCACRPPRWSPWRSWSRTIRTAIRSPSWNWSTRCAARGPLSERPGLDLGFQRVAALLGPQDVVGHLAVRIAALPAESRELLEIMACLGGDAEVDLLHAASGPDPGVDPDLWLTPVMEDRLLVLQTESPVRIRFRHDWIQQAAYTAMSAGTRKVRQLAIARNLATVPRFAMVAAEQYLPVAGELTDPAECRRVIRLLRLAVARARLLANSVLADRCLVTAMALLEFIPVDDAEMRLRLELEMERHAVAHALGRFEQVDELYRRIRQECDDPLVYAAASQVQISSLVNRQQAGQALVLGLETLADLGHPVPAGSASTAQAAEGLKYLAELVSVDESTIEPVPADQWVRRTMVCSTISSIIGTAFMCESAVLPWLLVQAGQLWKTGGPDRSLIVALGDTALVTIRLRQDYATAHTVISQIIRIAQARGYEPEASSVQLMYALTCGPWFDPLEEVVRQARSARERLVRGGDLHRAGYAYFGAGTMLFDCASTLDDALAEFDAGMVFAASTGSAYLTGHLIPYQLVTRALRDESNVSGRPYGTSFDKHSHLASVANNSAARTYLHLAGGLIAAIFNNWAELRQHLAAAVPLLSAIETNYCMTTVQLLRVLDLAERARTAQRPDQDQLLREFDECRNWLAQRSADAPGTFVHLLWLADAERAWVVGGFAESCRAFDHARWECAARNRPWHQALITERLARFQFAHELEHAGRETIRDALRCYQDWGALGKVEQLKQEYSFLRATTGSRIGRDRHRSLNVSSETIDTLAVLRASQALSSETNFTRLRARVSEILCGLTGATGITVAVWNQDAADWFLPRPDGDGEINLVEAAARNLLPLSAFRYGERTREPLLVEDAVRDDRFNRDPYLRGLAECSLMVVPILNQGQLRAMLLLENRHNRAAFGTNRLDTVLLITGQLSVSMDNALRYADLEAKVTARTEALKSANKQLALLAVTDPLTGIANRRRLKDILDLEWRHSIRTRSAIGISMIDIDHFKLYNDRYGHPVGDECLRSVAATINGTIRDTDLLARYGGEEFAIVLPRADIIAARWVAERVRLAVSALAIPHELSASGIVTISVGVAAGVASTQSTAEQLISAADVELYRAKRHGRNRISG